MVVSKKRAVAARAAKGVETGLIEKRVDQLCTLAKRVDLKRFPNFDLLSWERDAFKRSESEASASSWEVLVRLQRVVAARIELEECFGFVESGSSMKNRKTLLLLIRDATQAHKTFQPDVKRYQEAGNNKLARALAQSQTLLYERIEQATKLLQSRAKS